MRVVVQIRSVLLLFFAGSGRVLRKVADISELNLTVTDFFQSDGHLCLSVRIRLDFVFPEILIWFDSPKVVLWALVEGMATALRLSAAADAESD